MLLRITYSNTKRFLKSTIETFKSYFAGGYQKLPKTPPCNPFSCTGTGRGTGIITPHFNHSYTQPQTILNHHTMPSTTIKQATNLKLKEPSLSNNHYEVDHIKKQENKKISHGNLDKKDEVGSSMSLVTRKLKELEMMDQNNEDLVLDIEEVLHYYSRLTCPVYRDIVEKFFVEMYSGTFVLSRVENSVSKKVLI